MSSKIPKPTVGWKKLLTEARELQGQLCVMIYRRTKILAQIFNDAQFRADNSLRDDFEVADWLDAEFKGTALGFLQLRAMLEMFPDEADWKAGDLATMHEKVLTAHEEASRPEEKRTRKSVKVAEHTETCEDRDRWKAKATKAEAVVEMRESEVERLRRENGELRRENELLHARVRELESLLQRHDSLVVA